MLKLGLTGGIASGKSAVAAMLREKGFAVLDADALAHQLIQPGEPAFQEIVREFDSTNSSSTILDTQGRIDRAKLGALVFADPEKLQRLNAIVHPRVREAMNHKFARWVQEGTHAAAFVEAALLVEAGYRDQLDGLWVTFCKPEQQLERLRARGLSEDQANRRIAAQLPVAEKLRYATETIDCSGSLEETRHQVDALIAKIRAGKISSSAKNSVQRLTP
ncbi:MAG TPA: dephospho-CoA kinase [Candidatus Acidoferrum sp.]|jgi:dephospho-CoA kinase